MTTLATAAALVRDLEARGARVEVRGTPPRLRVEAPEGVLDEVLRATLRERKPELLSLLAGDRDQLPPVGDPRRPVLELIDDTWSAGCYVAIAGGAASIQPRHGGAVPGALCARLLALERDVVALLARVP